jgi:nucleotide-binding universal stress UspA family protein
MFTRILVPTDFSAPSDAALAYGRAIAGRSQATLHLMHVAENLFLHAVVANERDADAGVREMLEARFTDHDRNRLGAVPIVKRSDEPADEIVTYAHVAGAGLIVMGTHGRSGVAHVLVGSVAERVVRAAPCPVLTVKEARPVPETALFNRILVPTDFSGPSNAALEYARLLAARFGGSLHLLHVVEDSVFGGPFSPVPEVAIGEQSPEGRAAMLKKALARLDELVTPADRARFRMTTEVIVGKAADTIARHADVNGFDVIVMGTHGRTGITHMLFGSVAERVVRTAQCPVLTTHVTPEQTRVSVVGAKPAVASA